MFSKNHPRFKIKMPFKVYEFYQQDNGILLLTLTGEVFGTYETYF